MKIMYKDFELEVKREDCMAGYPLTYYTIYEDGYEHVCSFTESTDTIRDIIKDLKEWVDYYLDCINKNICHQCDGKLEKIDKETWFCEQCLETYPIR